MSPIASFGSEKNRDKTALKGGYLDFSHLTELKKKYITEIYMKKQYKPSMIKNLKITEKKIFNGVPLKG